MLKTHFHKGDWMMQNGAMRVVIETIVKKTLKELKDSPERSTRKLIDMALDFTEGRFQSDFLSMAQTMLENKDSSYYDLIKDVVANVDENRLLTFGMNLGYNSFTMGAEKIRKKEAEEGFNVPWIVSFKIDEGEFYDKEESYDFVIEQGEKLGIYSWMFYYEGKIQNIVPLIKRHKDSAFMVLCNPGDITTAFLDCIIDVNHLMPIVRYEENAREVYDILRERKLLYSFFFTYGEKNVENILNGNLLYDAEQHHPVFTAVIADGECSDATKEDVYGTIVEARKKQIFKTVSWDINRDNRYIDGIISDDSCLVRFDPDGALCMENGEKKKANIFEHTLEDILRQHFPKTGESYSE